METGVLSCLLPVLPQVVLNGRKTSWAVIVFRFATHNPELTFPLPAPKIFLLPFAIGVRLGYKRGKTMEREVDPNAVTGGKIRETKGELLLTKAEIQKQTKMGQKAK